MSGSNIATGDNMAKEEVPDKAASFHIRKPNRTVTVEPIVLVVGLCGLPMGMLSQFYIVACYTGQLSNGTIGNSSDQHGNRSESICDVNKSDPVYLFGEEVQRRASNFNLVLVLFSLIPALFVTTFIGAYSDQAGRRYAIIPPIVGSTVRAFSYVVVIAFELPAEYVLLGAVAEGLRWQLPDTVDGLFRLLIGHRSGRWSIAEDNDIRDDDDTRRRWKLCVLLFALFMCAAVRNGDSVDTLFEMNRPLCWTSDIIGYFMSAQIAVVSAGAVLTLRLLKCCMRDEGIALTAGLLGVVHNAYTAFVQNPTMMYVTPLMSIFDYLFIPTVRALMSSLVHNHEQGALYGGIAFTEVICSLVGDVLFNSVYSATLYIMTGFVYLVMAAFFGVGCLLLVFFIVKVGREYNTYMKFVDEGVADGTVSR
ncbi:hypothetical protein LSAT2_024899 [Lamellibrachia satsuma]|nr:hypothetical protein LSAT2_024899 [Lamellibrachia satsuma]